MRLKYFKPEDTLSDPRGWLPIRCLDCGKKFRKKGIAEHHVCIK